MSTDPTAYIGAVTRIVEVCERDGKPARAVIASRSYDTDIADLWDAISNAERIPRWFMPISGELRLGGRYQLHGNAGGTITTCEPPHGLEVTWEFGGGVTWLKVELAREAKNRTRLTLEHLALVEGDMWDKFGPGAVGVGWDLGIYGLARHLESGRSIATEEGLAFLGTPEGKVFVIASSDGWTNASIAAGTPDQAARDAGARTTAAYTGGGDPG
jgi:uncharacterized protein YndB with AHSA1/START domain